MRISVTDRCNLRCNYCMPNGIVRVPMAEILTYEEIALVCTQAAVLGIDRFRITGGEPLVRKDCAVLVSMLKQIRGVRHLALTTNGVLLAGELKPCLCYADNVPIRDILRSGGADREQRIREKIRGAVEMKPQAHCFERREAVTENRNMSQIGG